MASICCSPPDSVPACWRLRSRKPREISEHALEVLPDAALVGAGVGAKAKVLLDRQIGEGAAPVRHMRDAEASNGLGRKRPDRLAAKADVALPPDQARERPQGRRLAGAVRSEERGDAPVLDDEVEPEQRLDRAIERRKAPRLEDRLAHAALPR